jgi:hypothetical protein
VLSATLLRSRSFVLNVLPILKRTGYTPALRRRRTVTTNAAACARNTEPLNDR